MQNKLYFLDESEKSRILNLHENRTNKKYLGNDVINEIESFIWGVSKDEKILFTENKIFFMEGETPKSLEYNLESLPHLLNVLKKEYDKRLTEGSINLVKYFSIPRKFLSEITKSLDSNIHKKILKEWDDKFNSNFRLLNENVELITESLKTKELWDDVVVLTEQVWSYLSNLGKSAWEGVKSVGKAVGSAAKSVGNAAWSGIKAVGGAIAKGAQMALNAIGSAAKAIIMPIITQGVIPFLRWLRRNLNTYRGMIIDIVASMFPTYIVMRIIWGLIVLLDIYEILKNDFDPYDPERQKVPFIGLIGDVLSLLFTAVVGRTTKAALKAAMKTGVTEGATKKVLTQLVDKLPQLRTFLNNAKSFIDKFFGKTAGDIVSYIFNGVDTIITKLVDFIKTTFKIGTNVGKATGKEVATKRGTIKLALGFGAGVGLGEFMREKTLSEGQTSPLVKQAKESLLYLIKFPENQGGLPYVKYNGPIDEKFDSNLTKAIKQIQTKWKLPVTGKINPIMAMALGVDLGPGNLEKLLGKQNYENFGKKMAAANQFLEKTFGSAKGTLA